MFWILLWIVISIGLLCAFVATLGLNMLQIRAWKNFADKAKLTFVQKHALQPPSIIGTLNGYDLRAYTMIERNDLIRRRDVWSFVEVDLKTHPSLDLMVSKSAYQGSLTDPDREAFTIDGIRTSVCEADKVKAAKKFLTAPRIEVLKEFWAIKNQDPMILCNETACTLISRTSDALSHPRDLNAYLKKQIDLARRFDGASSLKATNKGGKSAK